LQITWYRSTAWAWKVVQTGGDISTNLEADGMAGLTRMTGFVAAAIFAGGVGSGAAVYAAQKCSMCHSLDGKGQAKGPLDGVGSKMSADDIRKWIVTPAEMTAKANATRKPVMRAYPNLPKDDLDALVAFLASKKKA
jgi:mono/diheme cytochrome c family protein